MSTINSGYDMGGLFGTASGSSSGINMFSLSQQYKQVSYLSSAYSGYSKSYGVNNSPLSSEESSSVINFKEAASALNSAASALLSKNNLGASIFEGYTGTSSNTDALSVSYKNDVDKYSSEALLARRDSSYKVSAPTDVAIKTLQTATAQKNTGAELNAGAMSFDVNQFYSFELSDGDKSTTISFATEPGDNNRSVQEKMAKAINDKNAGVTASVSVDSKTGKSSLVIQANETGLKEGEDNRFAIKDITGNAVALTGAANVSQKAQNAQYLIGELDTAKSTKDNIVLKGEAELKTSKSNDIKLDDRTTVTLKKATDNFTSLTFEKDTTSGINAVRKLVNGFNSLMNEAKSNSGNSVAKRLQEQLSGVLQTYGSALSTVGITKNKDGYLEIDDDKMKAAAKDGKLQKVFESGSGSSYGIVGRLNSISKTVMDSPTKYVTDTGEDSSGDSSGGSTVSNYSKLYFNLQKYENLGTLYNSLF